MSETPENPRDVQAVLDEMTRVDDPDEALRLTKELRALLPRRPSEGTAPGSQDVMTQRVGSSSRQSGGQSGPSSSGYGWFGSDRETELQLVLGEIEVMKQRLLSLLVPR